MKVRLYEDIYLLNQGFEQVIREMERMKKSPPFNRETLQGYLDNIEELWALTNVEFTYHMQEREHRDAFRFEKKRRAWEKKLQDPEDVYLEVEHQEEERKKRGLPSRVGIPPIPRSRPKRTAWKRRRKPEKDALASGGNR